MKKVLSLMILTLLTLTFMNAEELSTVPKIDAPSNVTIVYTNSTSTVKIDWDAVPNTSIYYIYNQSNPYGVFTLVDSTESTTWNGNFTENKKFFQVTAKELLPEMILVEGGTFTMGDHFSEGNSNELPLHSVTVSDYFIGTTEVTQDEWDNYMPADSYDHGSGANYPVYYVSWYEIIKFCNLRSMNEELTPCYSISGSTDPAVWGSVPASSPSSWDAAICNWSANGYRMPTEAEWEYAARGGIYNADNYRYSGCLNEDDLTDYAWYVVNSEGSSHPVGTKLPNQLGIFDMSGNEYEWCWDWFGSYTSDAQDNPTGPATGTYRIFRGGHWGNNASSCRVAYRYSYYPYYGDYRIGFRLARTK